MPAHSHINGSRAPIAYLSELERLGPLKTVRGTAVGRHQDKLRAPVEAPGDKGCGSGSSGEGGNEGDWLPPRFRRRTSGLGFHYPISIGRPLPVIVLTSTSVGAEKRASLCVPLGMIKCVGLIDMQDKILLKGEWGVNSGGAPSPRPPCCAGLGRLLTPRTRAG